MKKFVIRCTEPGHRTCYVKHSGRVGGFVVTYSKADARRMRLDVARKLIAFMQAVDTRMAFDVSEVEL